MKINLGMSEVLVISGASLYNSVMWLSLTMIILGLIGKVCMFSLEFNEKQEANKKQEEQEKKTDKVINDLKESLLGVAAYGNLSKYEESH